MRAREDAPGRERVSPRPPAVRPAAVTPGETGRDARPAHPVAPAVVQRLQGAAGNRAVAGLLAARRTRQRPAGTAPAVQRAVAAPPASGHRAGPSADPKFAALKSDVRGKQKTLKTHPPARAEAGAAAAAAKAPPDDREAQGKAANAEKMNAAKPGEFDKAAFIRAVNEAIAAQAPKNLDEADKFAG
ncbi:MAG TPA: hypothetical protein VGD11_16415, partial [Mycobacteriales bacterium]